MNIRVRVTYEIELKVSSEEKATYLAEHLFRNAVDVWEDDSAFRAAEIDEVEVL